MAFEPQHISVVPSTTKSALFGMVPQTIFSVRLHGISLPNKVATCPGPIKLSRTSLVCFNYILDLPSRPPNFGAGFALRMQEETNSKSYSLRKQIRKVLLVNLGMTQMCKSVERQNYTKTIKKQLPKRSPLLTHSIETLIDPKNLPIAFKNRSIQMLYNETIPFRLTKSPNSIPQRKAHLS